MSKLGLDTGISADYWSGEFGLVEVNLELVSSEVVSLDYWRW